MGLFGAAKKKDQAKGGFGRVIWLVVGAFLICWAFFLGVLVGQGSLATPDQMAVWQRWLASLPGMKDPVEAEPSKGARGTPTDLTFYRGVAKTNQAAPAKPPAKSAKPTPAKEAPKKAPAVEKAPEQKGRYSVQVASLKQEAKALEILDRLKKSGVNGYVVRAEIKDLGPRYRVRVGPFPTREKATETAGIIRLKHKLPAYVAVD